MKPVIGSYGACHHRYNGESHDYRRASRKNRRTPRSNTVELLTHDIDALRDAQRAEGKEIGDKIRALAIVAEQNEGRAAQMMAGINGLESRAGQMMDAIARLARVADNHEDRISDLEI